MKRLHISVTTFFWMSLVAVAGGIRLLFIYLKWPIPDSDEAVMDIMAKHIAYGGEHPIFYYGQAYMGTIQAYLGAVLMHIFGISVFTVRLGVLLLYTGSIVCMYFVVKLLYTTWFAIAVLVLCCFGTGIVLQTPLLAKGGYAETPLFSALIFLLTSWIMLSACRPRATLGQRGQRWLLYGALGGVYGLGIWSDQLILSAIMTSGLFLLLCCRRELLGLAGMALVLGVVVGAYPLIVYNAHATATTNSLYALLQTTGYGEKRIVSLPQQIAQALLLTVPATTGLTPLCDERMPIRQVHRLTELFSGPQALQCVVVQGGWTLGIVVLWCVAVGCVLLMLWRLRWQGREKAWLGDVGDVYELRARQYGRLMILGSGALWLFFFSISRAAAEVPYVDNRYLGCIIIATPAVMWPLWLGLRVWRKGWGGDAGCDFTARSKVWGWMSVLVTCVIVYMAVRGTIEVFASIPQAQAVDRQRTALIAELERLHVERAYSEYWTCNWIIFESNERVICSNVTDNLKAYVDRYPPYRQTVHHAAHAGYVFPVDWGNAPAIASLAERLGSRYHRTVVAGYIIYYYQ